MYTAFTKKGLHITVNRKHGDHTLSIEVQGDRQILLVYEIVCGEHLITAACKVRLNRRVPRKAQRGEPAAGEDLE